MTGTTLTRAGLLGVLLTAVGCSSADESGKQIAAMNTSNIRRLSNMYAGYQNTKGGGVGPKDEAEFTSFISTWDPNKLTLMGIDGANVAGVFTSERDGKPFKVRYKVGGGRGSKDAVVFEQEGKDGKKQVGFTNGDVEEVEDARYNDLWNGKKTPAGGASQTTGRPSGRPADAPTGGPPK